MNRRALSLGISILALSVLVGCGSAGQVVTTASAPAQVPGQVDAGAMAAPQLPAPAGLGQGIQVHGRWSIDVRNPGGALSSHTEFDNALWAGQGDLALASFLGRTNSLGLWDVTVDNAGSGAPYAFVQSHEPPASGNLTVTVPSANPGQVVLQGSETATSTFTAVRVATGIQQCPVATTPGTNCAVGYRAFTAHDLAAPGIAIVQGQSVMVKIVFSFS
ncbi:MAG: hypothetical protein NVSMB2_20050 [Chloroflexota bacterium]